MISYKYTSFVFFVSIFLSSSGEVGFNRVGFIINTPDNSGRFNSIAIDDDDRIVVAGYGGGTNGLIARFNTDGTLDTNGFNAPDGFVTNVPNTFSYNSVAIDSQGRIVVAGTTDDGNGFVARFNTDGTLDTNGFNAPDGFVTNVPNTSSYNSVAIDSQGRIVVAGTTDDGNGFVARFNTGGTLDTNGFNAPNGFVTNVPGISRRYESLAIGAGDKIVVAGRTDNINGDFHGLIARFNADGTLDANEFNFPDGFVTDIPDISFTYNSVVIDHQGKILVAGRTNGFSNGLIARFNNNGALDTEGFNSPNGFITDVPDTSSSYYSIAIDSQRRILVSGQTDDDFSLLLRLLSSGSLNVEINLNDFNLKSFRETAQANKIPILLLG